MNQLSKSYDAELSRLLLHHGVSGALEHVEELIAQGLRRRSLYLDLLGPAAERVGDLWCEDQVDFLSVNVAAARIQNIIRATSTFFPSRHGGKERSAIFASVPGEAHTIGVQMAAELQRAKGWGVDLLSYRAHEELIAAIQKSSAPIVALSIGTSRSMHPLYNLVKSIRANASHLKILVSGGEATRSRDALETLGVDAIATTYQQAERKLNQLAIEVEAEAVKRA